jgi:predicted DNA-binding transcriptional regulator AlpA
MRVKNEIIEMLRKNAELKRELLYRMGWSEPTLYRHMRENTINGDLTKVLPVKLIAEGMGMPESEILTVE